MDEGRKKMSIILQVLGYGWSIFGLINFAYVYDVERESVYTAVSMMTHLVVYGPGLLVGGLGTIAMALRGKI